MKPSADKSTGVDAEILFGVAGWSYKDWEGIVYPADADGTGKMLAVAAACDLLEINTTFYNTPRPGVAAAWARRLNEAGLRTRLVVKLNRVFTHEERFTPADVRAVHELLAPLDDDAVVDEDGVEQPRLLGLLVQFPWYFRLTAEATGRLEEIAEAFPDHSRVLELRHHSWDRPITYDWLRKRGYSLANIDLPASRRSGPPGEDEEDDPGEPANAFPPAVAATGEIGYLRLHGRNSKAWFDRKAPVEQKYNYLYDPAELDDLAGRIRELAGRTRTVAVVGNNHYRGKALATVLNLANLVAGRSNVVLPPPMLAEYPQLATFAKPGDPLPAAARMPARKSKKKSKPTKPTRKRGDDNQLTLFD